MEDANRKLRQPLIETMSFAGGPEWNVTTYTPTLRGKFFSFPWDPSARHVVGNAIISYLSYHDNFAEAFPGTPADNFALSATGNITVSAGYHRFCTTSLDGSELFVDGRLLFRVDNNNYWNSWYFMHPVCQDIQLDEGIHTITVNYFKQHVNQTGSVSLLEVSMDGSLIILNGKAPYISSLFWDPESHDS
jgi:hypothetical protein